MLETRVQIESGRSCAQTNPDDFFYNRSNFGLDTIHLYLVIEDSPAARKLFFIIF